MENKIILTEETSIMEVLDTKTWLQDIKSELQKTVDFTNTLTINDLEDINQIKIVKEAKNWYVKTRNTIERAFKSKRDEYNIKSKMNLEAQRDVISVIEWEEQRLAEILEKAEIEKLKKDNLELLPIRIKFLAEYEAKIEDEILLLMKDKDFQNLLLDKKQEYLAKKEAELKAEQEKIQREKELEEAKKNARIEAELEAERKHKAEIEQIKREQEAKELAEKKRKEDEENARIEAEQREKEAQIRLEKEKEKAYIAYRDNLDYDFFEKQNWKIVFYKKVGEFII